MLIKLIIAGAFLVILMLMREPKLTDFTKTVSDTVCHDHQSNAYKILIMKYNWVEKPFTKKSAEEAIDEKLGDYEKLCPIGGAISILVDSVDLSKFLITGSKHGGLEQQILGNYSKDRLEIAVSEFYESKNAGGFHRYKK